MLRQEVHETNVLKLLSYYRVEHNLRSLVIRNDMIKVSDCYRGLSEYGHLVHTLVVKMMPLAGRKHALGWTRRMSASAVDQ